MSRFSVVAVAEVPVREARDLGERAQRRAERMEFADRLLALEPGSGQAIRVDDVPTNLRPTWRGRMRSVAKTSGREFVMGTRGGTVWFMCAEDARAPRRVSPETVRPKA